MATMLRPAEIRRTREALRLSSSQFASVLGVHPTTISRWENAHGPVPVEGMAYNVLSALGNRIGAGGRAQAQAERAGQEVSDALVVGGVILALALLVSFAANE